MNAVLKLFSVLAVIFIIGSCGVKKNENSTPINIYRLDEEIMAVKSKEDLARIFTNHPEYPRSLYRAFPDDTALISHVYYLATHPETKKLYQYTQSQFKGLEKLSSDFKLAFKNIKNVYPEFKEPKIITTFSGLENDLFVSDSLIIIALDAFAGPKAPYRPDQPNYLLSRYTPEHIVPTVIRFLSNSYNKTNTSDQSFLADILFFGKSLEFTKEMLPNTPDSLIIGYTNSEITDTWNAQDLVWAHVIDKNLLYEMKPSTKEKYLGERPNVPEIGPKCPGRIGQWLGWRIVQMYRTENPKVTFQELMANPNAKEILQKSKYRGQIED